MGTFLRTGATEKRVHVHLPFHLPYGCVYDIVASNDKSVRITVGGQDAFVMAPDGSVAINLALLEAKVEEAPSRWTGFDSEELETMQRSISGRHRAATTAASVRKDDGEVERLDRLWAELYEEINARQGIEPPYAGQEEEEDLGEHLTKIVGDLEAAIKRLRKEER
jgi:hypothetical protein